MQKQYQKIYEIGKEILPKFRKRNKVAPGFPRDTKMVSCKRMSTSNNSSYNLQSRGSVSYIGGGTEKKMIKNLNLQVFGKKKVCIVGSIGSGKSSLLMALAGELNLKGGRLGI